MNQDESETHVRLGELRKGDMFERAGFRFIVQASYLIEGCQMVCSYAVVDPKEKKDAHLMPAHTRIPRDRITFAEQRGKPE